MRDVELVIGCTIQCANLANQRLWDGCGIADLIQRVQGDSSSDECGGDNELIQDCNDYAGPDSGGEMLQGQKQGARSMGSGCSGSIAWGYKQASNRRVRASAKIKISRLVN